MIRIRGAWFPTLSACVLVLGGETALGQTDTGLQYVTQVSQYGPVGFRDPVGAISPDGVWLAYGVGRELRLERIGGGPVHQLGTTAGQIRYLTWLPDGRSIAVPEREGRAGPRRWVVFGLDGERKELWPGRSIRGRRRSEPESEGGVSEVALSDLDELVWSPDGRKVAGVARDGDRSQLWLWDAESGEGSYLDSDARLSYPAISSRGDIACLAYANGRQSLELPCGERKWSPDVFGPIAFSPDGAELYCAVRDERGFLNLWRRPLSEGKALLLSSFERDSYAPSVARDGRVLFRKQTYRTSLAMAPAEGGPSRELTTFQSETPSWNWTGTEVGFTYGSWRRVIDDFHYPDISQDLGVVRLADVPASEPSYPVRASGSEDQGMFWSPNGRFVALHSHYGGNDDVWLQPADGSETAHPITQGGYETGWPRWSKDGKWILYTSYVPDRSRSAIYLVGMDQETGEVTRAQHEVSLEGYSYDAVMAEWSSDGREIVFESAGPPGRKGIYRVAREGGRPKRIHEFDSEQVYSGLAVSPDDRWIAFIAPAPDGYFQVFRIPSTGGTPEQITSDPSHKTQPAYSPDGREIAFTVWTYESQFWLFSAESR